MKSTMSVEEAAKRTLTRFKQFSYGSILGLYLLVRLLSVDQKQQAPRTTL